MPFLKKFLLNLRVPSMQDSLIKDIRRMQHYTNKRETTHGVMKKVYSVLAAHFPLFGRATCPTSLVPDRVFQWVSIPSVRYRLFQRNYDFAHRQAKRFSLYYVALRVYRGIAYVLF